jgi:amino acid adenylation domain-containing protein
MPPFEPENSAPSGGYGAAFYVPEPEAAVPAASPPPMRGMAAETGSGVVPPPAGGIESLHHLVEGWAARTPEAVALVSGEARLSYRELDARANRLARYLRALGVGPEVRVAISLERGPHVVVAVLAVLKAGGAYVPLDPSYPAERLAYMLGDSAAALLLTRAALAPGFPAGPWRVVPLDEAEDEAARLPATSPGVAVEAGSLAYLIYTSGSTGRPKGVMVAHGGLGALARAQSAVLGAGPGSRVLQFAPTSFDASVAEMGQAFAAGATLVLARQEEILPGPGFTALLRERGVTHVTLPPSVLAALPPVELPALEVLAVAGEACGAALVERWGQGRRFVNAYGPTEATVCVTMGDLAPGEAVTIGRALPGVRAYVVAEGGRMAEPGEAGELCAGGGGVARGYHGRPAATAERFVPDPFSGEPGARMYRTGDLVRAREDGRLEYLGRIDRQVKVRGNRVELDEVEGVLLSHPGVAAGAVAAYTAADGLLTLAAHVVPGPAAPSDAELRAWLAERLPSFMLPSDLVRHAELPLSPSGKVDRARLPRPAPSAPAEGTPPRTPTEHALARIWGEVLGMESVPVDRPFLELGGHSLRAMSIRARVTDAFGVEVPPHVLLRSGSVEEVAALLDAADGGRAAGGPAPERAPRDGAIPVSVAQEAIWFFEQLVPGQMAYRAQAILRLRGALDVGALERSLTEIVHRHEIFRTTFPVEGGAPVQRIHAPWPVALPVREVADEAELAERVREEFMRPFDNARLPLVRWSLLRRAPGEHVLLMVEHHFVHDGWSFGVFLRELRALYLAFLRGEDAPLPEQGLQFADYAAWQRRWMESEAAEAKLGFWERRLAGVPPLELPTDFPRPPVIRFRGAVERVRLDPALAAEARAFSREHGVTLFVTLLAAYQALLARYSGQRDFCVGSAVGNRGQKAFEGVIGMIVNTVALRADLDGHPTGLEHLRRVRETTLDAYAHQDVPFERVVRRLQPERSTGTLPLCQALFSFHNAPMPELSFGGLDVEVEEAQGNGSAKFDLQVVVIPRAEQGVAEKADEVVMVWEYSTDLFARDTVVRMVDHFHTILAGLVRNPDRPVEALPLLGQAERRQVVASWNPAAPQAPAGLVHERIAARAASAPDAVAVVFEEDRITYGELDARANRLARRLARLGAGPEARVGVCLERSVDLVVSLLAVLKTGGAYLPLDPSYPAARLAHMVEDAGAALLVTQESLLGGVPGAAGMRTVSVDGDAAAIAAEPDAPLRPDALPGNAAYVIYTSGSTGRPKGVLVTHEAACSFFAAMDPHLLEDGEAGTWLAVTRVGFDIHVLELLWTLSRGFRVVVAPDLARTAETGALARRILRHGVTHLQCTPSLLGLALAESGVDGLAGLRRVLLGGEALPPDLAARVHAAIPGALFNVYGPTEATVWSTAHRVDRVDGPVSIGQPLSNTRGYVLDDALHPQPVGVPGELCLGGAGVARGYLDQAALTAERFAPDPFSSIPGARMYRTGDRARWKADGTLEFLGRLDQQVKIRGFRIEPGEIEAALREHPSVRAAAVTVREDAAGDRRLVAYFVGDVDADALRAHLGRSLPEHMVPAAFVAMDALPLTPGGKLDRRGLPAPDTAAAEAAFVEPRTANEAALAAIWAEVLGRERVGVRDNFFHLGGHSLLAARAVMRVREQVDGGVAVVSLFEHPTIERYAAFLAARSPVAAARTGPAPELPPIEPAAREGRLPLSFAQERLWFVDRLEPGSAVYNIPAAWRLAGALDPAALERALGEIVRRHEALRTAFVEVDGAPVQVIAPFAGFSLPVEDLSGLGEADREAAVEQRAGEEARRAFDLSAGSLFRATLLRLGDEEHVLLISMHHVVSDGWSMGVLYRELSALYAAYREGGESPLPELPVQYADYAVWQREHLRDDVLEGEQGEYWRAALTGAPELLELPTDRPRPPRQGFAGAALAIELDESLTAALRTLSQRHGTTLYMTVLAGWAAVLARLSGQNDVVIGTPTANRGRSEIEGLIGFFVNTLAVRVDVSGAPTVAELLRRVRERTLEAQRHQDFPFEQVVERVRPVRTLSHTPLFQVVLAWQEMAGGAPELPGIAAAPIEGVDKGAAPFDLMLGLAPRDGRIAGHLVYATALFDRATAERYAGYLRRVLEEMTADDRRPADRLQLVGQAERARLLALGEGAAPEFPRATVDVLFAQTAAAAPQAVALAWDGGRMTYAELDERANRLAHHLRRAGVAAGTRVGICMERGPEMIVATLAALKAGGAYVPLDPAYPAERLAFMLADTSVPVLVTESSLADRLPPHAAHVVRVDTDAAAIAAEPAEAPAAGTDPEAAAYVMYTSGSTGQPKGVEVPHQAIVRLVREQDYVSIDPSDVFLQLAPASFDAATLELWGPLLNGARLAIHPAEQPTVQSIGQALADHGVTVLWLTAGLFHLVVEERIEILRGVRQLLAGGDVLSVPHVRRVLAELPQTTLINGYGPTENTTFTCCHRIDAAPPEGASIPVGRPIANTYVRVLDAGMQPVPVGVPGELYAGGAGLALGYLNQPELTAEKFVADPHLPGARLYRTGDRVRWREVRECESAKVRKSDGDDVSREDDSTLALSHSRTFALEFLGRVDTQVKIRGFRVEPGEIEGALRSHDAVRDALVLTREDAPGDRRLVAYYLADEPVAVDALQSHLAGRLPGYMVPAAYVWMDAWPLTPNGKVDRRALPAPEAGAYAAPEYEAPVGEAEQAVAAIWAELLGTGRVGRGDNFFELGGHSLVAVRMVSRMRQALGVEISLRDLFERPLLADFARVLKTAAQAEATAIVPVDRTAPLPLSFAQQRLWFLEQMGNLGGTYHVPMRLRLRGGLDHGALERALDRVVARHEALRTTFFAVDGEPVQRIASIEESAFRLMEHDLRAAPDAEDALRRLVQDEAGAPFDLARGPLFRGRLIRIAADDHVLLLTMHHIVSDGWSTGVLFRELGALYAAFARGEADPLPPLPVQYADYAVWHRRWVEGPVLEAQAEYWTETLAGAPELLELPTDRPRPAKQDFTGALVQVALDEALTAALKTLSQRHGTTPFMTLLAGWAAVLARLSGQDDVVIGTPTANRGRAEVEELIGFFVNTLPLRVDLSGAPTAAGLLDRVRALALEGQRNQDIPFEQVVERVRPTRSLAHAPLFQVMFAWQNAPGESLELPGLAVGPLDAAGSEDVSSQVSVKFDLSLTLWEDDGRIEGAMAYATALFDRATVERHVGYLRRVLQEMVGDDATPVHQVDLLSAAERRLVLEEWSAGGAADPADRCIHHLFEAWAARTPDAVALVHADERLTYAELNARANRLSRVLAARGVEPGATVGVCLEWRPELVVALLATLKVGGVYVPLDPSLPAARLAYIAEDAGLRAVVTSSALADRVPAGAAVRVDVDAEEVSAALAEAVRSRVSPADLAYIIYTSGSTGLPKGVAVEHGPAAAHLSAVARVHGIVPEDRVLQFASAGFDASLEQVFSPLLAGATLVLRGAGLWSAEEFRARVRALGVTVAELPPAYWQEVATGTGAEGALPGVRLLLVSGEALPASAAHVGGATRLANSYGPTEAVISATEFVVPEGFGGALVPIGRPLPGRAAYVLDTLGAPVPVGVAGELHIGGGLLARGYLGRPALTAERFVPDPFGRAPGGRLYRTGDRVRWNAAGDLEFLGRTDFQVKIRGFRIELGEIEARLREHPTVRQAVVLAREDAPGEKRLVAYVVGDADSESLRAHLAASLPAYMVPDAYVRLEALPVTSSGKLDRRALPAPDDSAFARRGDEPPQGPVEEALAEIWSAVLGVEDVGRRDHFFDLGGHSLRAVRVISRVREGLGVEVPLEDLFERPVLADFARGLETAARAEATAIAPVERSGPLALSFAQQRLWFLEQMGNLGSTYHIPMRLRLRGALDRDALVRALDRIVARHEVLRTSFPTVEGEPVQRIAPVEESGFRLMEHDLRTSADAEDELRRIMADEAGAPFDLARGPLFRGRLIRMAADDHVLLLTMHHIVSDGWSTDVLHRELGALYSAFARGDADPLPPLPVQYADYAAWQRRWVNGEVLQRQADYWRETLSGAPELLELPTDHPRPARQDFAGAWADVELDEALTAALKTLGQRHGATLYVTLLAGWAAVLARLSGQGEVVVGTPSANRGRSEIEGLIGFFVNTLALRVDLSDSPSVAELLGRVKERSVGAQHHQDIPFEQVVELVQPARSLAHTPLFQVMFAWQNEPEGSPELPGLALGSLDPAGSGGTPSQVSAKFDLSLSLREDGGRVEGGIAYATALFERETVERYVGYLRRVLEAMVADDAEPVDRLDLLSAAERRTVVEEWNATDAAFPTGACIHELFEAQVERTPDAEAVAFEGERLTYAELNARANRLAHHLRTLGVGPDARVGICVERGPEMVAALLAILKSGGAYVPLDPAYPADRLRYMLEDSAPAALITQSSLAGAFTGLDVPVVEFDAPAPAWAQGPKTNPARAGLTPNHLAYVIYTSGSTGRPKGVMVQHRSLVNHTTWQAEAFGIGAGDTVLQRTSISFDASVWELWTPLATGARMLLISSEVMKDPGAIGRVMAEEGVTVAQFVPPLLQAVLGALPVGGSLPCRTLFCGGEPLSATLVEEARAAGVGEVVNLYGPTEATIDSTWHPVPAGDGRAPAIGRPIANARMYVLDVRGAPTPVGVAGELYVGGAGVARGYLGRAALTAERFVPDPFSIDGGARMYRTGDLGRWRADGTLEFLGRTDFQVKVRGFRIELGEIEAGLRSHDAVRDALVLAREDEPGDRRLVAYYLADEPVAVDALRVHLGERLPEYMVPAAYVWMQEYPRTPNGKTDRRALPAPGSDAFAARGYEAPDGETEEAVAAIWADLLRVERVGRHDDFFQLGGNSLLATRLVFRIRREMDVEISVNDVFEKPELALLAQQVLDAQLAQFDPDQIEELLALARATDVG